jgi:transcriptional regulator with XRE-family HTH domain
VALKKDKDILILLGNNIRKARIKYNLTQAQLAFEANLTREFINKVETGKYNISVKKLSLIAECLGIKLKDLF